MSGGVRTDGSDVVDDGGADATVETDDDVADAKVVDGTDGTDDTDDTDDEADGVDVVDDVEVGQPPTDDRPPADRPPADRPLAGGTDHGWSWYLVRVSGLFLAVLLPLHFAVVIVRDDVGHTTLRTVTARFADARWQALELVTIVLALLHGFLALRTATLRSNLGAMAKSRLVAVMAAVAILLVLGTVWAMLSLS